jgi:precorrin-3B synthase
VRGLSTHSAAQFATDIAALGIAAADGVPILCNPLAGLNAAELFDGRAFATALRRAVTRLPGADRLDPKVSIVIDTGAPLNLAHLAADIRVRAQMHDGATAFRLAIGGDDATAFDLGSVALDDGVEAVSRLLFVLAQRGARAREIITGEGLGCFEEALGFACRGSLTPRAEPHALPRQSREAIGQHPLRDGSLACGVGLAFGHAEATALQKLANAAAAAGARGLRAGPNRTLLAIGLAHENAAGFFAAAAELGFVARADDPRRHVVACAGAPLCASAHIAARAIAPQLAETAAPYLREGFAVHVSGCAKGCAHPGTASLTVVGTAQDCALIANGSARGTPFTTAPLEQLPEVVAAHLRQSRGAARGSHEDLDHV